MAENKREEEARAFLLRQLQLREWIEAVLCERRSETSLFEIIRDGTALCHLAESLRVNSIPCIKESPRSIFQVVENLRNFRQACVEDFHIPLHRCFPLDDIQGGRFDRLMECVEALAVVVYNNGETKIPLAIDQSRSGIFSDDQLQEAMEYLRRFRVAPLRKLPLTKKPIVAVLRASESPVSRHQAKKIKKLLTKKGDEEKAKNVRLIVRTQAHIRGFLARRVYHRRVRQEAFRKNIVMEMLQTEQQFCAHLRHICDDYMLPLGHMAGQKKHIINVEACKAIFSNADSLLAVSELLLHKLEPRVTTWKPAACMGDLFVEHTKSLRLFMVYVSNYDNVLSTMHSLAKNSKFQNFINEVEANARTTNNNYALPLDALLITPVQRIPRYVLLLKELRKHTPVSHPDYSHLNRALTEMEAIAKLVNDRKRQADNTAKIMDIQTLMSGNLNLVAPHRKYVREGPVTAVTKSGHLRSCYFFLFSDILLCTQKSGRRHRVKDMWQLTGIEVHHAQKVDASAISLGGGLITAGIAEIASRTSGGGFGTELGVQNPVEHCMEIEDLDKGNACKMAFSTKFEVRDWIKAIERAQKPLFEHMKTRAEQEQRRMQEQIDSVKQQLGRHWDSVRARTQTPSTRPALSGVEFANVGSFGKAPSSGRRSVLLPPPSASCTSSSTGLINSEGSIRPALRAWQQTSESELVSDQKDSPSGSSRKERHHRKERGQSYPKRRRSIIMRLFGGNSDDADVQVPRSVSSSEIERSNGSETSSVVGTPSLPPRCPSGSVGSIIDGTPSLPPKCATGSEASNADGPLSLDPQLRPSSGSKKSRRQKQKEKRKKVEQEEKTAKQHAEKEKESAKEKIEQEQKSAKQKTEQEQKREKAEHEQKSVKQKAEPEQKSALSESPPDSDIKKRRRRHRKGSKEAQKRFLSKKNDFNPPARPPPPAPDNSQSSDDNC